MQVDPIKPKLKPPGSKRLKLKCDVLLSSFAFKITLCRYIEEKEMPNLKEDRPGLKRSQYKEALFKLWGKSPMNPQNYPAA